MSAIDTLVESEVIDGKNKNTLHCKFCKSTILRVNIGEYISEQRKLPLIDAAEQDKCETVTDFWLVKDMFKFENVGFSNTVENTKYLTCADCERGPIGYHDLVSKYSFVALNRVNYV